MRVRKPVAAASRGSCSPLAIFTPMVSILRVIGAVPVACMAASSVTVVFAFVIMPIHRLQTDSFYYTTGAAEGFLRGFAFVFIGSLITDRRWRVAVASWLVPLGICAYILAFCFFRYMGYLSPRELALWHLSSCIVGGLAAVGIRTLRARGQQDASPNGGPATRSGDSDVTEGPPSVS